MNTNGQIKEKKNQSGCAIILLCVAFLLIGAGGMYYFISTKLNVNNHQENNTNSEIVSLNNEGILVKELISRLDYNTECGVNSNLYKNAKTTTETLDKNYLKLLVAKEANKNNITGTVSFTKEEFDTSSKILFGEDINLTPSNITDNCVNITYDSVNQKYIGNSTNCEKQTCNYENQRYIVKAEKDTKNLYIYVAVATVNQESKKISNINDLNSVIKDVDSNTFDITKDYEKVNNYKYTFNYDDNNNNYIFKSIEIQK